MIKKNDNTLGELLKTFTEDKRYKSGLTQKKIETTWEELMGQWIAKETESIRFDGNTLILRIHSAALRQELHFSKDQVREKLNEKLGEDVVIAVVVR